MTKPVLIIREAAVNAKTTSDELLKAMKGLLDITRNLNEELNKRYELMQASKQATIQSDEPSNKPRPKF